MAISANSFNFLDKDLEVGLKELTSIVDNKVYSIRQDIEDSILDFNNNILGPLRDIVGKVTSTIDMVKTTTEKVINTITTAINKTVGTLIDTVENSYIKKTLDQLIDLDRKGVEDFLRVSSSAGSMVFCYNLDTLTNLLNGYEIPQNILDGLIASLSIDWLNRQCKSMSPEEEYYSSNKENMNHVYTYDGVQLDKNNYLDMFSDAMFGYYYNDTMLKEPKINKEVDFEKMTEDEIVDSFGKSGDPIKKKNFLDDLEKQVPNNDPKATRKFIDVKVRILELPSYERDVVIRTNNLPRSKDMLGSVIKNLQDIDLYSVTTSRYTEREKKIWEKLHFLKGVTKSVEFTSRNHNAGQFQNFNFEDTLSIFDEEDKNYFLASRKETKYAHRYQGLHPTTEVFLDDSIHRAKKKITRENDKNYSDL